MKDTYRAVLIGCSRMGAFIDHEVGDLKYIIHPYSHAAVYTACDRTDLVACSDLRPEVMAEVGRQYGVPAEKQYTDYRQMIEAERPDIVSIATQPEGRAEIAVHAAEHGARAIYAEKAMTASMAKPMRSWRRASATAWSSTWHSAALASRLSRDAGRDRQRGAG